MFSSRPPASLEPNALAVAVAALRRQGARILDLTASNPTTAGLAYPEGLLAPLGDPAGLRYDPQPFGLPAARAAVAADYERRAMTVAADRVVLTASSSESYSLLFKLLCDPGDTVLVPVPSYPLFEHLARLEGVTARAYRLEHHGRWSIDLGALERSVDSRTRAVIVVAPNNPTGSLLARDELRGLHQLCGRTGLALVGDEVFADYRLHAYPEAASSVLELDGALVVSLGGLSKSIGLPQLKLGWMAFGGPADLVEGALARLDVICDAYLSVGTPVQLVLPHLLEHGSIVRRRIADRLLLNHHVLRELAAAYPACRLLPVEGGWAAIVQAPAIGSDEARAVQLVRETGVLVHPGCFFDFERDGYFVLSLLVRPDEFRLASARLLDLLARG